MPITTKDSEGPAERHGLLADFELLPVQAHLRTFELLAARRDLLQITRRVPGRRLRAVALRRDVKQRCFHSMLALTSVVFTLSLRSPLLTRTLQPLMMAGSPTPVDETWTTTASGLQLLDVSPGSGDSPSKGSVVKVEYTGWLEESGKEFDSSVGPT